jgi:hypothetical protein
VQYLNFDFTMQDVGSCRNVGVLGTEVRVPSAEASCREVGSDKPEAAADCHTLWGVASNTNAVDIYVYNCIVFRLVP